MTSRLPGGGRSGSIPPDRRLPVNAQAIRAAGALVRRARRPTRTFPLLPPSWPDSVPRPPIERTLGVDYDTSWARRYPSRFARLILTEAITTPAVRLLADPTVAGLDRLAHLDEPVVFAPNHASHLDTPLVLSVLPEPWRYRTVVAAGADYFFTTRAKAAVSALTLNAIPLERTRVSRQSATEAARLLDAGWSLLIFPEGGRSPDGWAQPHTRGAAWLAARTGRAIVPVHLEGTGRILPRHATRIHPGSTRVTFGRPIRTDDGPDVRDLADRVERSIAALADEGTTDWWTATKRAAARTTPPLTGPGAAGAWRRAWALGDRRRRGGGDASRTRWPKD